MLDFMRRHAQSWMIKVALGAIVVVFIFWGIWNPREGRERDLVRIGKQTITIAEAKNYYQNLRERYQSVYGEKFTEDMAKKLGLKERALKDLIHKVLLLREAQRLGLRITPKRFRRRFKTIRPSRRTDSMTKPPTCVLCNAFGRPPRNLRPVRGKCSSSPRFKA